MPGPPYHGRTHIAGGTDPIPGLSSQAADLAGAILALTGLDAFWKLNEPAGTTGANSVLDSSGNGYHLTPHNNPTYLSFGNTAGPPGETAVVFSGSVSNGGYLDRATTPPGRTNNFTAFGWHKTDRSSALDIDALIFRANGTALSQTTGWRLWFDNADYKLRLMVDTTDAVASNAALTANTWYMWAVVRDAGTWKMYINGVQQAATSSATPTTFANVVLGAANLTGRFLTGSQSYVALINRVLTAAEILNLHTIAGFAGLYPAGYVWTSDGTGAAYWALPTIEVTY